MKSNLLLSKILLIQTEYRELLDALLPKFNCTYTPCALDDINLFWFRHIEEVKLFLKMWFPGENSYVFTASTFMDFDYNEHLPFLLMGDKRILDDPLSKYSEIQRKLQNEKDAELMYEQIIRTTEDNLKLLDNVRNEILILPLRLLSQSNDYKFLYKEGERAFISLFDGIDSLNDYFSKCSTFNDIMHFACKDIGKLVMFSEHDNIALPFEDRFRRTLADTQFLVDESQPDSYNFFILVFGCIQQAIDIIISCIEYDCIPYIRYPVSFHYISLLLESMLGNRHMQMLCYKMSIAFAVHQLCDTDRLAIIQLDEFIKKNREYRFCSKLFQTLTEHGIDETNFSGHTVKQIVVDELEKLYSILSDTDDIENANTAIL